MTPSHTAAVRARWVGFGPVALMALLMLALLALPALARAATINLTLERSTGTAPFTPGLPGPDGNDEDADDDIVRSNDLVTYSVSFNVNDGAANGVEIRHELPAGMRWTRLPATCLAPQSSIGAPDSRTLVCHMGTVPSGQARTLTVTAQVTELSNATVLSSAPNAFTIGAANAPTVSRTPDDLIVSSRPHVDAVKSAPTITETIHGGVAGFYLDYPVRLDIPNIGDRGQIGVALPPGTATLVEDYSGVSANAQLVSVSGAGWTAIGPGAAPQTENVTISYPVPTTAAAGRLAQGNVVIFVPLSDIQAGAGGAITATNLLSDLTTTGQPAEANLDNNDVSTTLSLNPGTGFGIQKRYVDRTNTPGGHIPGGANSFRNGFAPVTAGQIFQSEIVVSASNPVAPPFTTVAACDVFDTVTQRATTLGTLAAGRVAWASNLSNIAGASIGIEYSTEPTSTNPDRITRYEDLRTTDCSGAPAQWSTTPPADPSTITKVRATVTNPPREFSFRLMTNLTALPGDDGTILANYAPHSLNGGAWTAPTYRADTHSGNNRGDRVILSTAQLVLDKQIDSPAGNNPSVRGGEMATFSLRPRVLLPSQNIDPAATVIARQVRVVDILPPGTTLATDPAASPAPVSVEANPPGEPQGSTRITWDMGTLNHADTPVITYTVNVSRLAFGTKVNRAIVTSPDVPNNLDPDLVPANSPDPRFGASTLQVDSIGGIQIEKSTDRTHIEPGDRLAFTVTYANLDPQSRNNMDVIDVLPHPGDGAVVAGIARAPASAFSGTARLRSVDVTDGELIRYTDAPPAAVMASYDTTEAGNASYGDLPAPHLWCTAADIAARVAGCPEQIGDSTAIRVSRAGALGSGEQRSFAITMETDGNRSGDLYANHATLRSSSIRLGTVSQTVATRVVASRIGDLVWNDLNQNGRQDAGEPPVAGVAVRLTGTDKHGRSIDVTTTTDAAGTYAFFGAYQASQDGGIHDLVSGAYVVTFVPSSLPERASFTVPTAAGVGADLNSDADPVDGRTAAFTLPDPSPTGRDGQEHDLGCRHRDRTGSD